MENHYPPVIEKSIKVIQRFEEKFGWFVIRVYQFPQVEGFGTFLESVQRTLLRHGTAVWYIWAKIRGTDKILLIYFGRGLWAGHFEEETDAIIPRLWQRQASAPYMVADTITVNQQNKDNLSDWLVRYLIAIGATQTAGPAVNVNWHKKTFGTAQTNTLFPHGGMKKTSLRKKRDEFGMLKFTSTIPADKTICKLDNIIRSAERATLFHQAALHS